MRVITEAGIVLGSKSTTVEQAILECGNLLVSIGAVSPEYLAAMFEREQVLSSAIGAGLAIPHGTEPSRSYVNFDQLVLLQLPQPIDWNGESVQLVIGIASRSNSHVELLGRIAALATNGGLAKVIGAKSKGDILRLIEAEPAS